MEVDGHTLAKISQQVVLSVVGHCHQYFCLRDGRVIACDGLGWIFGAGETYINQSVTDAVRHLLSD